ncbi:MAG: hypothetical protein K2R98_02630 [Gemmataceae bacterium]|nr:hypothetical protein [Gemmataceae bacterium]
MATATPKIPLTELRHLYGFFDLFSSLECHRAMVEEARRDRNPGILADFFQKSVERFREYSNVAEPFYPDRPPRKELPDPAGTDGIGGTLSLTALLKAAGTAEVTGSPELDFTYIDRELVPARTTGNATFENDERSIRVRRLDWLLANSRDKLPIIAEVKVGNDKNPFYALVQLLMYAAELATASQLARLQQHYPDRFAFPLPKDGGAVSTGPVMDLYIVLSNYNPRSGVRQEILEGTSQLAQQLVVKKGVSAYVRRIACLDAAFTEDRRLQFTKLFSYSDT